MRSLGSYRSSKKQFDRSWSGISRLVWPGLLLGTATTSVAVSAAAASMPEAKVTSPHAFTGRMCAASRWIESQRKDSLFSDPLGKKLAGEEGMSAPMGAWIMTPRTRFAEDLLKEHYALGCRQLVVLGAGMDSRAFRVPLPELAVFEVDMQTTFDVKEPLLEGEQLTVKSRAVVATEFADHGPGKWSEQLLRHGFDKTVPTVWLLEGLLMYLHNDDQKRLMHDCGKLSAEGSVVFHDAVSASYLRGRVVVGGAPFIGGSDDYARLWRDHGGFTSTYVRDFDSIEVDRKRRRLEIDESVPEATHDRCAGDHVVLFVTAQK